MLRVLVMMLVAIALFLFALALVWYFALRVRNVTTIGEQDFDDQYDDLVAKGELVDRGSDRDAAWRDFDAWQRRNEDERSLWNEGTAD